MKKIIWLALASLFLLGSRTAFALEQSSFSVEYQLPYPGLLPDNPLYFLKTARDRIISFLISDPLKKAEFDFLQSDKRLAAGYDLFQKKGEEKLIISTISKGDNYFELGIKEVREAKNQGIKVTDIVDKMHTSLIKHQEILKVIKKKISAGNKNNIKILEQRVGNFEKEVSSLR